MRDLLRRCGATWLAAALAAALGLAAAGLVLLVSRTRLAVPQAGRRPSRS